MKTMMTGSNAITDATIEGKKKKQLSYQMTKERIKQEKQSAGERLNALQSRVGLTASNHV